MVRVFTGEAGIGLGGLWINDRDQEWTLKVGNITGELFRDFPELRRDLTKRGRSDPTVGVHYTKRF